MSGSAKTRVDEPPNLPFRLACWAIGLLAFAELVVGGVALAGRFEASRQVKVIERIVPHVVTVPSLDQPAGGAATPGRVSAVPPAPAAAAQAKPPPAPAPLPEPTPLAAPRVADPVAERLVAEARKARVAEDMGLALVKLEEAARLAPDDPNILYEFGLAYELMGVNDRAAESYQKVFDLGTTGAGALYELAAIKLRDGFEQPEAKFGRISLGRIRVFRDQRAADRERIVLTVPVQAVPGEKIDPADLEVVVRFFDEVGGGGDPQPASPASSTSYDWVTLPVDWQTGEELLRVAYTLPEQDLQQDHLFGERRYYGQVVELVYRGTLIDSQAWPRILARRVDAPERDPLFLEQEMLPPEFNPEAPLLPPPLPEP